MTALRLPPIPAADASATRGGLRSALLPGLVAGAWLLIVVGQVTGNPALAHQHESTGTAATPLLVAGAAFLGAWLVMIAATMLPASLRAIHLVGVHPGITPVRPGLGAFLVGFVAIWTAFGGVAFVIEAVVQRAVLDVPWLAVRPWLPAAGVVAVAAVYQFTALKRRSLAACRHPARLVADRSRRGSSAVRLGLEHGLACVGNAWAVMLVMVVAGLGDVWWLAALTGVMVYEATGRYGQRAASAVGLLLVWLAVLIALPGWLPT